MAATTPVHLTLRISTKDPIELGDFVGAFASLGAEFERFIRETRPDLKAEAQIYVKEVRQGSIEAELLPYFLLASPFISSMDSVLIVEQFLSRWGSRLSALIRGDGKQVSSKAELADFTGAVQAIANDPNGSSTLEAAVYEDGRREIKAAFKFTTKEAQEARRTIDARRKEIEAKSNTDYQRRLMVFTRSDIHNAKIGKRSGELVQIESISPDSLPLMYGSGLSEERIKHEIRDADENIYKKGFNVDVNVEMRAEKPVAYSVTHVHEVIDLDG